MPRVCAACMVDEGELIVTNGGMRRRLCDRCVATMLDNLLKREHAVLFRWADVDEVTVSKV
jgi:hypothetical protein